MGSHWSGTFRGEFVIRRLLVLSKTPRFVSDNINGLLHLALFHRNSRIWVFGVVVASFVSYQTLLYNLALTATRPYKKSGGAKV